MTGYEYEHVAAQYLKNSGYHSVKVTKASGDYGVDITATKNGKRYAVQCKYYSGSVGVEAVQQVVAGRTYYGCDSAAVITNSSFTKAAETLAAANDVILIGGVSKAGARRIPVLKILAWAAYLFFASVIVSITIDTISGQSFWKAAYNIVTVLLLLISPALIYLIYKKLKQRRNVCGCSSAPAKHIDAKALIPYLPISLGDYREKAAVAIASVNVPSVQAFQRVCFFGYDRASEIFENMKNFGLIETESGKGRWTEKALRLKAEGREEDMV